MSDVDWSIRLIVENRPKQACCPIRQMSSSCGARMRRVDNNAATKAGKLLCVCGGHSEMLQNCIDLCVRIYVLSSALRCSFTVSFDQIVSMAKQIFRTVPFMVKSS